jgi:hypothetical protein
VSFKDIAEPLIAKGIPVTPVRPGTKRAFLPDFPTTATTDIDQIYVWDRQYPDHGVACVARAEEGGIFVWETDSPDVLPRVMRDTGHDALKEINTFRVRSRPGRGHTYFKHNSITLATLPNLSQGYVIGQDWSLRTNREYCVGAGSLHPDTGQPYTALNDLPLVEAPDWLIQWWLSQKIQPTKPGTDATPRNERGKIVHGNIHSFMLSQAGRMRRAGLTAEEIEVALLRIVHEQCEPPIDDEKVRTMAYSVCKSWPAGDPAQDGQKLAFNQQPSAPTAPPQVLSEEPEEEINYTEAEYPVFPKWVMHGTSIYEGFVKPYCDVNSRVDYLMWVPTAIMAMNWLGTHVSVPLKSWKPSFYMIMIGEKGRANKSSSMKDGMKFLEFATTLSMYGKDMKNAEGRSVVFEPGSPEGLGTDMMRVQCKNAILFYDELSTLVSKCSIEGSGMNGALLKLYESNHFANSIKNKKDTYSIAPDSYVATLLAATTDARFLDLWAVLGAGDTGLEDRFTFILQPQELPARKIQTVVNFNEAALASRKLWDKAIAQGSFQFFDQTPLQRILEVYGTRQEIRAEKWALYFAIDLGLTEIDEDCVERGIAMVVYEEAVKKYLDGFEANNEEATIQNNVIRLLKKNKGTMFARDIERKLNSSRYGTFVWSRAFYGLEKNKYIWVNGAGTKGNPRIVKLLRDMKRNDD